MSSQHLLDKYKVPRESVDVESLAQELSRYLQITAEDTEFLSCHPARRDELVAELYQQPDAAKSSLVSANQFVQVGGDADTYLVPANAEIARLTPPATLEDRVARLHVAAAALLVFDKYKVHHALLDHPDLKRQVRQRKTQIMDEWQKTEFARLFPESAQRAAISANLFKAAEGPRSFSLPPLSSESVSATGSAGASSDARPVSEDEVAQFLSNPSTLVGKRFVCSPPEDNDEVNPEDCGPWEVVSFAVRKDEGILDREYMVLTEEFPDDPLPMGESQIKSMLRYSTFAV